jgi:hypothetical protein
MTSFFAFALALVVPGALLLLVVALLLLTREHGRGQGVAPKGASDIEYAGLHKNLAPGVDGSRSALNRGSAADLLL